MKVTRYKAGDRIVVGDVTILVVESTRSKVTLGIAAPQDRKIATNPPTTPAARFGPR